MSGPLGTKKGGSARLGKDHCPRSVAYAAIIGRLETYAREA